MTRSGALETVEFPSFTDRLRHEEAARLDLEPGVTDGPRIAVPKGHYPDGEPGPQVIKRMEKEGYTRLRRT